ncbi:MAG: hypothetical protein HRF49_12535 [bacterium]|jgi:hypothetical protein
MRKFTPALSPAINRGTKSADEAAHSKNTAPTWTNHPHALRPVESQQIQTNSATQFINVSDEISPSRRTYNPFTSAAGDTEAIAAKGRLVLVNGAVPTVMAQTTLYPSELFSHRNPTYSENTIALPSDRGALEISGTNLMYEGTRVKTWIIGRDVNPGGRGNGVHFAHGMFTCGTTRSPATVYLLAGWGNSINNGNDPELSGCDLYTQDGMCKPGFKGTLKSCCCKDYGEGLDAALEMCTSGCGCCCAGVCTEIPMCPKFTKNPNPEMHKKLLKTDKDYAYGYCDNLKCGASDAPCLPCGSDAAMGCCSDYCSSLQERFGPPEAPGGGGTGGGGTGGACGGCGSPMGGGFGSYGRYDMAPGPDPCDTIFQNYTMEELATKCFGYGTFWDDGPFRDLAGCGPAMSFVDDARYHLNKAMKKCCNNPYDKVLPNFMKCFHTKLWTIHIVCAHTACQCYRCRAAGSSGYTKNKWGYIVLCNVWSTAGRNLCEVMDDIAHEISHHCGTLDVPEGRKSKKDVTLLGTACVWPYCLDSSNW